MDIITASLETLHEQQPQIFDSPGHNNINTRPTPFMVRRGVILRPCVSRVKPSLDAQTFPSALQSTSKPICGLSLLYWPRVLVSTCPYVHVFMCECVFRCRHWGTVQYFGPCCGLYAVYCSYKAQKPKAEQRVCQPGTKIWMQKIFCSQSCYYKVELNYIFVVVRVEPTVYTFFQAVGTPSVARRLTKICTALKSFHFFFLLRIQTSLGFMRFILWIPQKINPFTDLFHNACL